MNPSERTSSRPALTLHSADRTVLPARMAGADRPMPPRRRLGGATGDERRNLFGAAMASISITFLLFGRLAPLSGSIGFFVVAFALFVAISAVLVSITDEGPAVRDRIMTVLLSAMAVATFGALVFVIAFTLFRGRTALLHTNFFTHDMQKAGPLDPLTVGGVKHAVVGTLWMIGIALSITIPLGITAAVYLNEIGGRFSRFVRTIVDAMTALPSIVAGLFIYATWILALHREKSGLAAALAISVMMLPIIIRASDLVLRLVPGSLREASAALGASQWRTVWHVVLPTARSGLATSVILGTARGIGETAPVLLTAGSTAALNANPTSGPMVSLPLAAYEFVKSPQPAMIARGFATAALLLVLILMLFVLARLVGGRGPGQLTKRHGERLRRASARDVARYDERRLSTSPNTGAPSHA